MAGEHSGVLRGKSFYLHDVKRHQSVTLTDIISRLGGKVDSFLTKDVNVVVTGVKAPHLQVDGSCTAGGKQSETPKPLVCGSRGKALLEKAIHSNEKFQNSVLANARSWGVKVYNVDEFLKLINHLNQKMRTAKKKRSKLQTAPHVKAGVLRGPYLKVEDSSRKFRPYYAQTLSFPVMSFSGKFSPFEPLIVRQSGKSKDVDSSKDNLRKKEEATSSCHKLQAPHTASATHRGPTKKSSGYCECCHIVYKDQCEHLQSEMHRSFIQNDSNYAVVDQLTAAMVASFVCNPNLEVDPTLIKSSTGFSQLQRSNSTAMVQNSVSENEKSLQNSLQDCDRLPANADNRGHPISKPIQSPHGQQNATSQHTTQNNSPDPLDKVNLGLYISCTTKVQDFKSAVLCVDIVPHHVFPKFQSMEKKPKNLSSVTSSEAPSKMLTQSSSGDNNIPHTITGDKNVPETQKRCEGSHNLHVLHMQSGLIGGVPNMVNSQNQKYDWDQGLKMCSNRPMMLLQQGEDGNSERCDQNVLDHRKLPSTKRPDFGISYFSIPHFLPFPHLSDYPFSIVNLKKRSRSFTPSPKLAKRRRISQSEKPNPVQGVCSANWIRQYSSVLSTMSCLPVSKVAFTTEMHNQAGSSILPTHESSLMNQIPTRPPLKYFTPSAHCLPYQVYQQDNAAKQHELSPIKGPVESQITTYSSDLFPPQLVPFFHEDHQLQCHQFHDPPELLPFFSQTPEDASHTSVSKAPNSSFLSHSGASVCIESALLPNLTWSTASSESDWDSGLLSWFTAGVPLQDKGGHDDLGLLLQKPHTGMQDGSYTSRLCSILQPS